MRLYEPHLQVYIYMRLTGCVRLIKSGIALAMPSTLVRDVHVVSQAIRSFIFVNA